MHPLLKNSLRDHVALVTGATSGIGEATAKAFAEAGAAVGILSHNAEKVERTCAEIRAAGGRALPLPADVANAAEVDRAYARLREEYGRLDIVVANAGTNGLWAPIEQIEEADWDRVFAINLKGTYLTIKAAVPLLKARGGSVVIVSSVNGTRMFSNAGASAYATTKAGQVAFGRMMALELAACGIRVNTVCPGAIDTPINEKTRKKDLEKIMPAMELPEGEIPLTCGKPGSADQVAEVIWFLASPLASHVSGAEIFVDGAESLLRG